MTETLAAISTANATWVLVWLGAGTILVTLIGIWVVWRNNINTEKTNLLKSLISEDHTTVFSMSLCKEISTIPLVYHTDPYVIQCYIDFINAASGSIGLLPAARVALIRAMCKHLKIKNSETLTKCYSSVNVATRRSDEDKFYKELPDVLHKLYEVQRGIMQTQEYYLGISVNNIDPVQFKPFLVNAIDEYKRSTHE